MSNMQNAYALVVGIADYKHVRNLPATVLKDARDVAELLARSDVCGYPAGNVRLLLDGDATLAGTRLTIKTGSFSRQVARKTLSRYNRRNEQLRLCLAGCNEESRA